MITHIVFHNALVKRKSFFELKAVVGMELHRFGSLDIQTDGIVHIYKFRKCPSANILASSHLKAIIEYLELEFLEVVACHKLAEEFTICA